MALFRSRASKTSPSEIPSAVSRAGFTSTSKDHKGRTFKTGLAIGSNYGPFFPLVNHYAVGRTRSGHWVQPTVNSAGTHRRVQDAYRRLLADILRKYT